MTNVPSPGLKGPSMILLSPNASVAIAAVEPSTIQIMLRIGLKREGTSFTSRSLRKALKLSLLFD